MAWRRRVTFWSVKERVNRPRLPTTSSCGREKCGLSINFFLSLKMGGLDFQISVANKKRIMEYQKYLSFAVFNSSNQKSQILSY
jgi:hypothetical protein